MKRLSLPAYIPSACVLLLGLGLTACASHKPVKQSQLLYHAPAQAYTLDLGSQAFRGAVKLRDSCTPEGSSLDITDNEGRFFRVDAVNLVNNPNIEMPEFADETTVRELVLRYYSEKVNTGGRVIEKANVDSRMGPATYTLLQFPSIDDPVRHLGLLIARRGNFAYVLQHVQNSKRPKNMRAMLGTLASEISVPGMLPGKPKQSDLPLYIDLKNSTPEQIAEWKKVANCS